MNSNGNRTRRPIVMIRGAGEQATGVGWTLCKAGFRVVMTEIPKPLMVRWPVCFGSAVAEGSWEVEDVEAIRVDDIKECEEAWRSGKIPLFIDPTLEYLTQVKPDVLVDAIMAKRNLGTSRDMASFTIGLGPGFCAGEDVHTVVETQRGHNLGRLISLGRAEPNTGIPGEILGFSRERVVYSGATGVFEARRNIGEVVKVGEVLGFIQNEEGVTPVHATLTGVLRGLLRTGTFIKKAVKVGDIDPRFKAEYCWTISEKARMLGASVLLAILSHSGEHYIKNQ
jgi:xanthine dehydrogenase accessory factor